MKKWLIAVLSVAWLVWEVFSANDSDPHTWPLTHILVAYVPSWVTIPAATLLAAWIVPHFVSAYKRREAAVVNPQPVPLPSSADASNRAFRTFIQGLGLDVATAVVLVLATSVTDMRWTKEYWFTLLALLGKTAILSAVAYAARKLMPPPGAQVPAAVDAAQDVSSLSARRR